MSEKEIKEELLKILACPIDKASVEKTSDGNLKCVKCNRIYPVIDGIPVMLPDEERQELLSKNEEKTRGEGQEEKAKFKPHPLLKEKKEKKIVRSRNLSGTADPLIRIVEQNQAHKIRIAKVTVLIFLIMFCAFLLYALFMKIKADKIHQKRVENIASKISECRKEIENSNSPYDAAKASYIAICNLEALKIIDWKNDSEWDSKKDFFKKTIEENFHLEPGKDFICPSGLLDMVSIPRGVFQMGSDIKDKKSEEDEYPKRTIKINYDFWVSRTEVTNMQFRIAYPHHKVEDWAGEKLDKLQQPACYLDWHMAVSACSLIDDMERKAGRVPGNYEYRLPNEAEWEYFARAGTTTIFFWGDEFGDEGAKFANTFDLKTAQIHKWKTEKGMARKDGFIASAPVGSFKANAFGLYDTTGNVWEWCLDWYNPRAYKELGTISPFQSSPVETELEMRGTFDRIYYITATSKVIRGGSWGNLPSSCRNANRDSAVPETKNTGIGFRIVLAPKIDILKTQNTTEK